LVESRRTQQQRARRQKGLREGVKTSHRKTKHFLLFCQMISASPAGDLKFLDLRNNSQPYLEVYTNKRHLTSIAVHRHAPLIVTGSSKQSIETFSPSGAQLGMVHYWNSFLGQRIGPISALHFHPYSILLAAGATDSFVSFYDGESLHST
jgi:regulator-associated protein of mTOR